MKQELTGEQANLTEGYFLLGRIASKVFSSIAVFELLRVYLLPVLNDVPSLIRSIATYCLTPASTDIASGKIAVDRVNDFLKHVSPASLCTFRCQFLPTDGASGFFLGERRRDYIEFPRVRYGRLQTGRVFLVICAECPLQAPC